MSIHLQRRGKAWRFRYDREPDAAGVRQRCSATFRGTRKEAEAQAAKLLADIANGVDIAPSTLTVASYLRAGSMGGMASPLKRSNAISSLPSSRSFRIWEGCRCRSCAPPMLRIGMQSFSRAVGKTVVLYPPGLLDMHIEFCTAALSSRWRARRSPATSRARSPRPRSKTSK